MNFLKFRIQNLVYLAEAVHTIFVQNIFINEDIEPVKQIREYQIGSLKF